MKKKLIQAFFWARCIIRSVRNLQDLNLGDEVWYKGEKWMLVQGVCKPSWDLMRGTERVDYVHESQFRKVRSLKNYWHDITFKYSFYMGYWFDIDVNRTLYPEHFK